MDEKTSHPSVPAAVPRAVPRTPQKGQAASLEQSTTLEGAIQASEKAAVPEQRKAYGTAKTENLRDSGLWRFILPAFVVLSCLALLAIPLIILVPLLSESLNATSAANLEHIPLTWVWIVMVIVEVGIATVISWGLLRIFTTQAGNYRK